MEGKKMEQAEQAMLEKTEKDLKPIKLQLDERGCKRVQNI